MMQSKPSIIQSRSDLVKVTAESEIHFHRLNLDAKLATILYSCLVVPQASLGIHSLPFRMSYLTPAIRTDIQSLIATGSSIHHFF